VRRLLLVSWVLAAVVVLLWIPPLGGMKVGGVLEAAFYYGALLFPVAGVAFAIRPAILGPRRISAILALCVHLLLFAAYRLLIGAPVS